MREGKSCAQIVVIATVLAICINLGQTYLHGQSAQTGNITNIHLIGTTSAISGTITGIGACLNPTTVSVAGARAGMAVSVTPTADPGVGASWNAWISSNDTVSVRVCSLLATLALTSSTYNVRVQP
jgi:hypothetical protein